MGMKNLSTDRRKNQRYQPYSVKSQNQTVDKKREYVNKWITDHRREWVYSNLVDPENALAYDASQAVYGTQKSRDRLSDKGYVQDEELSSHNTAVYHNAESGKTVLAYRGTTDWEDYVPDAQLAFGNYDGEEFKKAYADYGRVKEKYGDGFIVTGHSLGGTKAIQAANRGGGRAIAFNPGSGVFGLDTKGHKTFVNSGDSISSRAYGQAVVITPGGHSLNNYEKLFYDE
jgi:hypothetical protein